MRAAIEARMLDWSHTGHARLALRLVRMQNTRCLPIKTCRFRIYRARRICFRPVEKWNRDPILRMSQLDCQWLRRIRLGHEDRTDYGGDVDFGCVMRDKTTYNKRDWFMWSSGAAQYVRVPKRLFRRKGNRSIVRPRICWTGPRIYPGHPGTRYSLRRTCHATHAIIPGRHNFRKRSTLCGRTLVSRLQAVSFSGCIKTNEARFPSAFPSKSERNRILSSALRGRKSRRYPMKNLFIASALALTSILPFTSQTHAASVTVTTTERAAPRHHVRERHHRPHCTVKKVETRHHGKVVVKTTRVCR